VPRVFFAYEEGIMSNDYQAKLNKKVEKVRDAADHLEQDRALHSPKGSAGKLHFEAINGGSDQDQ